MSDVCLHVGPVKTGSTYLQDLLWRNRADLAGQGVLYPADHRNEMWFATNDIQDAAFIQFELPEARGAWSRVRDRILAFDGTSIVSHEVLGLSTEQHVARIVASLGPTRLHVVVMARSLGSTLPSLWQEKVKMVDSDVSWTDFLDEQRDTRSPWTDASLIVQRWLAHVPPARIHVVTVPLPGGAPDVLLHRFAAAVGIDVSRWQVSGADSNRSLDAVQVEVIRRLNLVTAHTLDQRARRRLVNVDLLPCFAAANPSRRLRLPVHHRAWIDAETARRVRALRGSGAVVHGDLDDLDTPPDAWAEQAALTETDVLEEALLLLAGKRSDSRPDQADFV